MQTTPFFRDATPTVTWTMRFFVGANIAVILYCAVFLVRHFAASGLGWPAILATALAGYFLADFTSGVVHWGMDTWFDERTLGRAIAIAREHHTHPHHIHGYGFLDYASLGSTPSPDSSRAQSTSNGSGISGSPACSPDRGAPSPRSCGERVGVRGSILVKIESLWQALCLAPHPKFANSNFDLSPQKSGERFERARRLRILVDVCMQRRMRRA